MTIFTSKDPAGRTAMELGLIFTGLAVGGMNVHQRGMEAARRAQEVHADNAWAGSAASARHAYEMAIDAAKQALARVRQLEARNANLEDENKRLRAAIASRDELIRRAA